LFEPYTYCHVVNDIGMELRVFAQLPSLPKVVSSGVAPTPASTINVHQVKNLHTHKV